MTELAKSQIVKILEILISLIYQPCHISYYNPLKHVSFIRIQLNTFKGENR